METWSGHLEEGCRVLYLAELVIIELEQSNLTRIPDEDRIFMLKSKHQN
jgi:predicted DNA-binding protein with PD1-like motif